MTVSTLTLRQTKGARLTTVEMDNNWLYCSDASNASFIQSGSGAVTTDVQTKLRQTKSVFDWMTAAQIADVLARTTLVDVSAAVQAACASMNDDGGGNVYMPAGAYRMLSGVSMASYSNVRVFGAGPNATSLWVLSNNTKLFNITGQSTRISIEDLWMGAGSALSGCYGIYASATAANPHSEIYSRHVTIQNLNNPIYLNQVQLSKMDWMRVLQSVALAVSGNPLYLFGVISSRFRDIQMTATAGKFGAEYVLVDGDCDSVVLDGVEGYGGTTADGFKFRIGAGLSSGPRLTRVNNCYSEQADLEGFHTTEGRDIRFTGCHAATNGLNGFNFAGGTSITAKSCSSYLNNQSGFIANGGDGAIEGCTASNNSQQTDATYAGMRVAADVTHWRVVGNRSGDYVYTTANGQSYGLTIGAGASD